MVLNLCSGGLILIRLTTVYPFLIDKYVKGKWIRRWKRLKSNGEISSLFACLPSSIKGRQHLQLRIAILADKGCHLLVCHFKILKVFTKFNILIRFMI